jgi:hypothetical protein
MITMETSAKVGGKIEKRYKKRDDWGNYFQRKMKLKTQSRFVWEREAVYSNQI